MASTLFEQYGGFAKVSRVVSAFYDKLLDSEILGPYFENVDMRRLIDHQTKFIAAVMGGPASYSNEHLERVHAHLEIDRQAFDEMVALLEETLEDFDFAPADIRLIRDHIAERGRYIIARR